MPTSAAPIRSPVTVTIVAGDGARHGLRLERRKGGRVWLACDCDLFARERWCRPAVEVLCTRYENVLAEDAGFQDGLEDIVLGTRLEETAHELDLALAAFERAQAALDEARPAGISAAALEVVRMRARDFADTAVDLDDALARFRRMLSAAG